MRLVDDAPTGVDVRDNVVRMVSGCAVLLSFLDPFDVVVAVVDERVVGTVGVIGTVDVVAVDDADDVVVVVVAVG